MVATVRLKFFAPSNKRLQLALRPIGHRLCPVLREGPVDMASHELESFDQLRRSFLTAQLKR